MSASLLILLLAMAEPTTAADVENLPEPVIEDRVDILRPARQGQVQCFQPNIDARTCKIMAAYSFEDDGRILSTTQALMDETGPAVLVVTSPVVVRNRSVCGNLENLPKASFVVAGQPATPGQESGYRLMLSVAPRKGEVCARWVGDGNGYVAYGSLDGKPKKDFDQRMIWVEPGEGYRVAP
jgi:hypothetical protein